MKASLPQFRGVFGAPEISDEAKAYWGEVLKQVYDSPKWQEFATAAGMELVYLGPEEFTVEMQQQSADFTEVLTCSGWQLGSQRAGHCGLQFWACDVRRNLLPTIGH